MRYEDASQTGTTGNEINARDDADHLASNDFGPATGNLITGAGTITGATGTDSSGHIVAIQGAGGSDTSIADGQLQIAGQYGTLTIDAEGNYSYARNPGSPEGVSDTFTYTLADNAGATDTANLVINIGDLPILQAQGNQTIQTNDGTVVLPAGVELSDVRVVGRDLVITLPDGSTMVIPDGAVFVPQLVLDGVEVPATNLAALLIDSEPKPGAGDLGPSQLSSGGNFALPPGPLDPGVPLGDLIPPTELEYTPPEFKDPGIEPEDDHLTLAGMVSVQLDDDVIPGKGGNPGGIGDNLPDTVGANVVTGNLPGSGGDGALTWALVEPADAGGFAYALQPDGSIEVTQVQDGNPVLVLTIEVDSGTGAFEITQVNPVRHAPGGDENNASFVINYSVTDEDGSTALGQINIDVDDDTPTATVSAGPDAEVLLVTDDADTEGTDSDSDATLADFSGVFGGTSTSPGADGAGEGTTSGYALAATSTTSGLSSHGAAINLYMVGTTVVGAIGDQPADLLDSDIVFTVAVDSFGVVTLTQMQQIDHAPETPSDAPFNDQFAAMADGLVTLTRSVTVIDNDGDSVTGSATVNIGQNLHFTDDGPTLDGVRASSSVTLDETNGGEPVSPDAPIVVTSDDPMIVGTGVDYGADGQGPAPVYGLTLLNGSAIGTTLDSGLQTALGDHPITLTLTSSTLITATYVDVTGTHTAFTIAMNDGGTVTVTQNTALEHGVDGPPGPAHDDSLSLTTEVNEQAVSLVNATVTYQDFDGDTASGSAPIGGAITFKDDGPSIDVTVGSDASILLVTDDDGTEGANSTHDETTADFSGAFSIGASSGGGDGTASISELSYHLTTTGGDSGLESHGNQINLYLVGTTIVGAVGAAPADLTDPDIVFTVAVDGDGIVKLTQFQQIDHPAADDPGTGTDAPFNDHTISMLDDSLITLHASATITDNDGDTATDDQASLDIAANLVFRDDGPTINASLKEGAAVHVDESLPGTDGAETEPAGTLGQVSVAISSLVTVTENPISADQPTTTNSYALLLGPDGGDGLVESGLTTSDGNDPVYLYLQLDGSVIGSTALTAETVAEGNTVFTVAISGGNVVLTQLQAVEHGDFPSNYDENTLGLAADALQLQVTGTDFDGDTDSDTVDLGSVITFGDDGPSVEVLEGQLPTNPETLAAFQLTTQDHGTEVGAGFTADSTTINFSGLFSLNTDGGSDGEASSSLTYDLNLLGAGNGPVDSGLDSHGNTIWLYQLDGNTIIGSTSGTVVALGDASIVFQLVTTDAGAVTQTQFQQIDHVTVDPTATAAPFDDHIAALGAGLINVVATGTITDNDNDVATDTETLDLGGLVRFQDDGPTADNEGNIATVDDSATALDIGNISTLLDGDNYHADGPAAVNAITIAIGSEGGTITIDGSGNLLYTAAADASGGNVVEDFTYTITDFDGDTATGTFSVTLTDNRPSIGTTEAAVDEEGLANGIAGTVYGDASDIAGESASASGNLTGLDFGDDGVGDIVLASDADTGLRTLSGQIVQSSWNAATHTLTGFVDSGPAGLDAGDVKVFTLQIDNVATGHYEFDLLQPVKHATANTEDDVTLSVDLTVFDSSSNTEGTDGVINITIDDDSPQVSNVLGGASVTLDETNAVPGGFPISATSATAAITATTAFGADGPAAVGDTSYGLSLTNGAAIGTTIASGLQTAVGDHPITLTLTSATLITATYQDGGTHTAFTITMDAGTGKITVQQEVPLEHIIDGPPGAAHNDALDLVIDGVGGANLVNATITIKDGDGDTHSGSTGIGDQITFLDDGPTINVTKGADAGVTLTTDDADTVGAAQDSSTPTSINFGGVFGLASTPGADGATTPTLGFALDVTGYAGTNGVDSGLNQGGADIFLHEIGGKIVGSTAALTANVAAGNTVFELGVSGTGVATLTQFSQIDHVTVDPTPGGAPYNDHIATLADGLVTITASSTITDNDGDTASDSETVDIGANLRFTDDGPTAAVNETGAGVSIDETAGIQGDANDIAGPLAVFNAVANKGVDPDMAAQFATNANAIVNSTGTNLGADGAGSTLFSLTTSDPANLGVDSGLNATDGTSIFLFTEGGLVVGRVGATAGAAAAGPAAFALSIDATGHVSMVQYLSIEHTNTGSADESLSIADGALLAKVTATDFDGDVSTATTAIGDRISFQDDGPVLGTVQSQQASNNPAQTPAVGTLNFNAGSDGAGETMTITATVTGLKSGGFNLVTEQVGNVLTAYQDTDGDGIKDAGEVTPVFILTVDPDAGPSGQYTFDLVNPLDPTVTEVAISGSSSFGAGPTAGQILENVSGTDMSVVSGYHNTASFDFANWMGGTALTPAMLTTAGVNGSTSGWGIDDNNFNNTDEIFVFDFGAQTLIDPDGAGGYVPPATTLPDISFVKFDFIHYAAGAGDAGDDIAYVVHYTDGTSDSGWVPDASINGATWQFSADAGKFIADVQFYSGREPSGVVQDLPAGKVDLVSVGTTTSTLDKTIDFSLQLTDGDGDPTTTANFTVQVANGLTPLPPAPVVLDTSGDGSIAFLDHSAGIAYDYNGDGVAEATAWVGGGDSILVRDANGDGTVTDASEFVFGRDGLTDMQALAGQYGDTLDANDADFGQFQVWNDANGNGAADAGELTSLADAGITSIGLVSDGIAYTAANGEVQVAGSGTYTMADGSIGISADAAFATGVAAKSVQEVERVAANSNNIALAAAVGAAGVAATAPAAAAVVDDGGDHHAYIGDAVGGGELVTDLGDQSGSEFSALTALQDGGFDIGSQELSSSSPMAISASQIGELASDPSIGGAPNALLDATDAGGMLQMPALSNGMGVTVSLEAPAPEVAGAQQGGAVEQILADALHGGDGADINAMLNALPGAELGADAGLHGLATLATDGVSFGDMGYSGGFTFDVASIITTEAMVLHHDAVQPVANG